MIFCTMDIRKGPLISRIPYWRPRFWFLFFPFVCVPQQHAFFVRSTRPCRVDTYVHELQRHENLPRLLLESDSTLQLSSHHRSWQTDMIQVYASTVSRPCFLQKCLLAELRGLQTQLPPTWRIAFFLSSLHLKSLKLSLASRVRKKSASLGRPAHVCIS